jgi:hypothetical protein
MELQDTLKQTVQFMAGTTKKKTKKRPAINPDDAPAFAGMEDVAASLVVAPEHKILDVFKELMTLGQKSLAKALELGEMLTDQKAKLEWGQWKSWFKAHLAHHFSL